MPEVAWSDLDVRIHPVPAWRFWVTMPDIDGLSAQGDVIAFLAQKFISTHRGIDYETVPFLAGVRNFPTSHHVDAISAVFVENNQWDVLRYLRAWLRIVIDPQGNFGLPADYKQPIQIDSLDIAGNTRHSIVYQSCAPVKPDPHDYDGTSSQYLPTSCSFVVDSQDDDDSSTALLYGDDTAALF